MTSETLQKVDVCCYECKVYIKFNINVSKNWTVIILLYSGRLEDFMIFEF